MSDACFLLLFCLGSPCVSRSWPAKELPSYRVCGRVLAQAPDARMMALCAWDVHYPLSVFADGVDDS